MKLIFKAVLLLTVTIVTGCVSNSINPSFSRNPYNTLLDGARFYINHNENGKALEELKQVIYMTPDFIPAHILYQDLKIESGKRDEVLKEYLSRDWKNTALYLKSYLVSRLEPLPERRVSLLKECIENNPTLAWVCLDLGKTLKELERFGEAEHYLEDAVSCNPGLAEAHYLLALLRLRRLDWEKAMESAYNAHEADSTFIPPRFFFAASYLLRGQYMRAITEIRKVKAIAPYYVLRDDEESGYRTAYRRELMELVEEELPQTGLGLVENALKDFPDDAEFLTFKAMFLIMSDKRESLLPVIDKAISIDPFLIQAVQIKRLILFSQGDYQKALDMWKRTVQISEILSQENKVSGRYKELINAVSNARNNDTVSLIRLAEALKYVGWEEESLALYRRVRELGSDVENEIFNLENHLSFLKALKKYCYSVYQQNRVINIVEVIDRINKLAEICQIPLKTTPSRELSSYFVLVRENDPFNIKPDSLGAYMARYNKFFDLGNNMGVTDFILLNRLVLKPVESDFWGRKLSYHILIGDETRIGNRLAYRSGRPILAGRMFLSQNGFYIAFDTFRPKYSTVKLYQEAYNLLLKEDIENKSLVIPTGESKTMLKKRLFLKDFKPILNGDTSPDSFFQCLLRLKIDNVMWHELGHIYDFYNFLPLWKNLGNSMAMAFSNGFSSSNIESRFEEVAEIFGLGFTMYPHFYLYQELKRLEVNHESVFELVAWAWYGRKPEEDPYRKASNSIFNGLTEILSKEKGEKGEPLDSLPFLSSSEINALAKELYFHRSR